jgi:hypothetical protein
MYCTPERLEGAPQIIAGAMQTRFHDTHIRRNRSGGFVKRCAFVLHQNQHFTPERGSE